MPFLTIELLLPLILKEIKAKKIIESTIIANTSLFLKNLIIHHYFLLATILSIVSRAFPAPSATQSRGASAI